MTKKQPKLDLTIDGRAYKEILIGKDKDKPSWKFQPKSSDFDVMPHYTPQDEKGHHLDVYINGKTVKHMSANVRMAGMVWSAKRGELFALPPIPTPKKELESKSKLEIAKEYLNRVKIG